MIEKLNLVELSPTGYQRFFLDIDDKTNSFVPAVTQDNIDAACNYAIQKLNREINSRWYQYKLTQVPEELFVKNPYRLYTI